MNSFNCNPDRGNRAGILIAKTFWILGLSCDVPTRTHFNTSHDKAHCTLSRVGAGPRRGGRGSWLPVQRTWSARWHSPHRHCCAGAGVRGGSAQPWWSSMPQPQQQQSWLSASPHVAQRNSLARSPPRRLPSSGAGFAQLASLCPPPRPSSAS